MLVSFARQERTELRFLPAFLCQQPSGRGNFFPQEKTGQIRRNKKPEELPAQAAHFFLAASQQDVLAVLQSLW